MHRCFVKVDFTKTFKYFDIFLEELPLETLLLNIENIFGDIELTKNMKGLLREKKIGGILNDI